MSTPMTIHVNGEPRELPDGSTVRDLLETLGLLEKRVVVEVNRDLVVSKDWPSRVLLGDDRVEVVSFVGGG